MMSLRARAGEPLQQLLQNQPGRQDSIAPSSASRSLVDASLDSSSLLLQPAQFSESVHPHWLAQAQFAVARHELLVQRFRHELLQRLSAFGRS